MSRDWRTTDMKMPAGDMKTRQSAGGARILASLHFRRDHYSRRSLRRRRAPLAPYLRSTTCRTRNVSVAWHDAAPPTKPSLSRHPMSLRNLKTHASKSNYYVHLVLSRWSARRLNVSRCSPLGRNVSFRSRRSGTYD